MSLVPKHCASATTTTTITTTALPPRAQLTVAGDETPGQPLPPAWGSCVTITIFFPSLHHEREQQDWEAGLSGLL